MNCKTVNGRKICPYCNQEKPLSEFPIKWKPNNKPSYGRCVLCTLKYDHDRRRKKGLPIRVLRDNKKPIIVTDGSIARTMRIQAIRPIETMPIHDKVCPECKLHFKGYRRSVFCTPLHADRYHRRIRRRKEKARMRGVTVEHVDPILVFIKHDWHCANCSVHTPRHLK